MGVFNPNSCLGSPFESDGFIPHSGSSSSLLRTTSPFSPQLHCYLSSRPKRTPGSPPPASCNSFIQFSVQGLMCSRPPPPRSHQKKEENYAFFFLFHSLSAHLSSRHGPQTGSHDTLLQSWAAHHQQAEIFTLQAGLLAACADGKTPGWNMPCSPTEHSI